ncbi:MAG: hypothetical protein KGL92_08675 [Gammaproteobacteria bacterium]|nr:hypothetical protein [Gammaproteobacteria bacterium]
MLDIRIPIGSLFVLIGALLVGYGLAAGTGAGGGSAGLGIDILWGSVMTAFGALFLYAATRGRSP